MIIKSFEISKLDLANYSLFLFYGKNEGLQSDTLKENFLNKFSGQVLRYEESEFINYIDNILIEIQTKSSKREIVTVNNFFVYNNNFGTSSSSTVLSNIANDKSIDLSLSIDNTTDINFENKVLTLSSNCKVPNASKIHSRHIIFDQKTQLNYKIYSSNYLGSRDLQGNDFGRSFLKN